VCKGNNSDISGTDGLQIWFLNIGGFYYEFSVFFLRHTGLVSNSPKISWVTRLIRSWQTRKFCNRINSVNNMIPLRFFYKDMLHSKKLHPRLAQTSQVYPRKCAVSVVSLYLDHTKKWSSPPIRVPYESLGSNQKFLCVISRLRPWEFFVDQVTHRWAFKCVVLSWRKRLRSDETDREIEHS
jgi:hypothetical protein